MYEIVVPVILALLLWVALLRRADRTMPRVIAAELLRTGRPVVVRAHSWDVLWDPATPGDPSSLDGPGRATYSLDVEAQSVHLVWKPRGKPAVSSSGPLPADAAAAHAEGRADRWMGPLIALAYGAVTILGVTFGSSVDEDATEGAFLGAALALLVMWVVARLFLYWVKRMRES